MKSIRWRKWIMRLIVIAVFFASVFVGCSYLSQKKQEIEDDNPKKEGCCYTPQRKGILYEDKINDWTLIFFDCSTF